MSRRALALRIAGRQNGIVREVNDIHIFVNQSLPLLDDAKQPFSKSQHTKDRRYYVPSIKRTKFAKRTDQELKEIYERFTSHALYETFLVSIVSKFEAFLADVIKEILTDYPQKLGVSTPGIKASKDAPMDVLWKAATLEEAIEDVIDRHVSRLLFAQPKAQFEYLAAIAGIDTKDEAFPKYYELKATRDLLVHNTGIANETYLAKSGQHARAALGQRLIVNRSYFDNSLALVKRISGIIKRDVAAHYPRTPVGKK